MDIACDKGGDEAKSHIALFKTSGGRKQLEWTRCGTLPPLPEVFIDVEEVTLELRATQLTGDHQNQNKGFRMLYSFHEVGSSYSTAIHTEACRESNESSTLMSLFTLSHFVDQCCLLVYAIVFFVFT